MVAPIDQFSQNIARVRGMGGLYSAVSLLTTDAIEKSDLLRAELVMGVSALDHFVHEFVLFGMLETFDGKRAPTEAFGRFTVPISAAMSASPSDRSWFVQVVRETHSYVSFQMPDRVADGIRLVSDIKLWDAVSGQIGIEAKDLKNRLKLIVARRNKIAHEADMDPSYPNTRWPIAQADVDDAVNLVERICYSIQAVAS